MARRLGLAALSAAALLLAPSAFAQTATGTPPSAVPSTWQAPVQLPLTSSEGGADEVVTSFVPGAGIVRGTRSAMARIGQPLAATPGRNRLVEGCREVAWAEAAKLGATAIEAVSAGRQSRDRQGHIVAPVLMRITYPSTLGYNVREAVVTCTADRRGRVIDARS